MEELSLEEIKQVAGGSDLVPKPKDYDTVPEAAQGDDGQSITPFGW